MLEPGGIPGANMGGKKCQTYTRYYISRKIEFGLLILDSNNL